MLKGSVYIDIVLIKCLLVQWKNLQAIDFGLGSDDIAANEAAVVHLRTILSIGQILSFLKTHKKINLSCLRIVNVLQSTYLPCSYFFLFFVDIIDLPIDAVIQSGVVPLLVDILRRSDKPQLQVRHSFDTLNIHSFLFEKQTSHLHISLDII